MRYFAVFFKAGKITAVPIGSSPRSDAQVKDILLNSGYREGQNRYIAKAENREEAITEAIANGFRD